MTIIIHQMGKVGSSAILKAFKETEIHALQTHNLGEDLLASNVITFLEPSYPISRVETELKLFKDQIWATKLIEKAKSDVLKSDHEDERDKNKLKIITLSRDAIDRFFSALIQNYIYLFESAKILYHNEHEGEQKDETIILEFAIKKLIEIILKAPDILGSVDFAKYYWNEPHFESSASNTQITQFGSELLVPYYWFKSNLKNLVGINILESKLDTDINVFSNETFEVLYLKFEYLKQHPIETEQYLSEFSGCPVKLIKENVSRGKIGYEVVKALQNEYQPVLSQCSQIKQALYTCNLGYGS